MTYLQNTLRLLFIFLLLPSICNGQDFDDSYIQYFRSVENIQVLETESQLSWIDQNTNDTTHWNKEGLIRDEMPRFQGCEYIKSDASERKQCADSKMLQYIYSNLVYPVEALEDRIEGQVIVRFFVNPDGSMSNASVVKDLGSYTGGAALDLLDKMNKEKPWVSGKSNGVRTPTLFSLPIKFKLGPENRIQHPKMYSKYYKTNDDWELVYDPEGEETLSEEAQVRMLISANGKVLNTRIYSPLSNAAQIKVNEIILDLLDNSKWRPGSTYNYENTMEYVFTVQL